MRLSVRLSQFLTGQRSLRRGLANEVQTLRLRSPYPAVDQTEAKAYTPLTLTSKTRATR
jgi:hypothetical protein